MSKIDALIEQAYRGLYANQRQGKFRYRKARKSINVRQESLGEQAAKDFDRRQIGMHGGVLGKLWSSERFTFSPKGISRGRVYNSAAVSKEE